MTSSQLPTSMSVIVVETLGALHLDQDGVRLSLEVVSGDGAVTRLSPPTDCLQSLIMTLPQIMKQALRIRRGDNSFRLVYPAKEIRIEQASDPGTLIATLTTADGFEISLGLTPQQLECFNLAATEVGCRGSPVRIVTNNN